MVEENISTTALATPPTKRKRRNATNTSVSPMAAVVIALVASAPSSHNRRDPVRPKAESQSSATIGSTVQLASRLCSEAEAIYTPAALRTPATLSWLIRWSSAIISGASHQTGRP